MKTLSILLVLTMSSVVYSQTPAIDSGSNAAAGSSTSAQDTAGATAPANQRSSRRYDPGMFFGERLGGGGARPVASFTGEYVYTFTDSQTGHNRSLMGWSAVPEVRLLGNLGLQADFAGLYVRSIYPGQNRFLALAGPRYTFAPRSRFTPFVYAEGGEVRLTSQANHLSDWNPVVKGGFGFEHKLTRGFAIELIPGEYVGQLLDNHLVEHSYSARGGITFNMYH